MSSRGTKFTAKWKTPQYYSDFLDTFDVNPTSGALATVTNTASIEQSVRNLVNTRPGSIPGRNVIGSKVANSLFDLATPASFGQLEQSIVDVIRNFEPRAENPSAQVDGSSLQENAVAVSVTYTPVNLPQAVTISILLDRVR